MSTPYRDPGFEYKAEYERFLRPRTGSAYVYSGRVKRAAKVIDEFITPNVLSSFADVDAVAEKVKPVVTNRRSFNCIRCALRAYVSMLNSNFEGRFSQFSAQASPPANDLNLDQPPDRFGQEVYRIIRDTAVSREIKALYEYRCQICGLALELAAGKLYAEAHHIRPLGGEHGGLDKKQNLICVCPNHHAQLDNFAFKLELGSLKLNQHEIDSASVEYHNNRVKA